MHSNKLFHRRIYIKALCLEPLCKLRPRTARVQIRHVEEIPDKISPKYRDDAKKMVSEITSQKIFWGKSLSLCFLMRF